MSSPRLVPHVPGPVKSSLLRKTRTIRVKNSTGKRRVESRSIPENPRGDVESGTLMADPEDAPLSEDALATEISVVEQQIDGLQSLKIKISALNGIVEEIGVVNNSEIIESTKVVNRSRKLVRRFQGFYTEAMGYFAAVKDLKATGATKDGVNMIPIAKLKSEAFDFANRWTELVGVFNIVKDNAMISLQQYISIKFRAIDNAITDVTTSMRKDTVHEAELRSCGDELRSIVKSLNSGIRALMLQTSLSNLRSDLMTLHINDVKSFLRIYNDAYYHHFPKSGLCSVDLAQFKVVVMACCNDVIRGVKVAFSLNKDIERLFAEIGNVQELLTTTVERLHLPQMVVRTVIKARSMQVSEAEYVDPMQKLNDFLGEDVSIVVCSRIEEFIESMQARLRLPMDPPELNVWQRLAKLETQLVDRLDGVVDVEKQVIALKAHMNEQAKDVERVVCESYTKMEEMAAQRAALERQIGLLQRQWEESEKKRMEAEETIGEKKQKIKQLIERNTNEQNESTLERIAERMTDIMDESERQFDFSHFGDNPQEITKVDKMNVFVLERRCKKCREFTESRRRVKDILRGTIQMEKGEMIETVVERLRDEVVQLRDDNSTLKARRIIDEEEIKTLIEAIKIFTQEKERDELEIANARRILEIAQANFDRAQREHAEALRALADSSRDEHHNYLGQLSTMLNEAHMSEKSDPDISIENYVTEQVRNVCAKLGYEKKMVAFQGGLLKDVEKWMNKMSNYTTEKVPIDQALTMMMEAIENQPNPLAKKVAELEAEMVLIGSEIEICAAKMENVLGKDIVPITKDVYGSLATLSMDTDNFVQKMGALQAHVENLEYDLSIAKEAFITSAEKLARVLQVADVDFRSMGIAGLTLQVHLYLDELLNPGANRYFISIIDLNELTNDARTFLNIKPSPNPMDYLPIMSKKTIGLGKALKYVSDFVHPLSTIFESFDFKMGSFDPNTDSFMLLREEIYKMHRVVGTIPAGVDVTLVTVITKFVGLASSFLSCIAASNFDAMSETDRQASFKFQNQAIRHV